MISINPAILKHQMGSLMPCACSRCRLIRCLFTNGLALPPQQQSSCNTNGKHFWSPPPTFAIAHLPFGGNEQLPTGVIVIPVVVVVVGATYRPSDFGASVGRTLRGVVKAWLVVVLSPNEGVGVVWSSGTKICFEVRRAYRSSVSEVKGSDFYMNLQGLKESSSSTNNLSKIIKILR